MKLRNIFSTTVIAIVILIVIMIVILFGITSVISFVMTIENGLPELS